MKKAEGAFLTISELSAELDVPQHILRYWETRFPALRPLQRAGNRRYYRPDDVQLARRIHHLLSVEGFTVKGAQKALSEGEGRTPPPPPNDAAPETLLSQLEMVRAMLARALGV
jgi:DNA-binding transcriptional MerR regulator